MNKFYVGEYLLDKDQTNVILDNSKYLLVVAGAGSGKTLTIVGKINYLLEYKKIAPSDILCISFTNEAVKSMKEKINNPQVNVMTFHRLGLSILDSNNISFSICNDNYLEFVVHEVLYGLIYENNKLMKIVLKYFGKYSIFFNIEKSYSKLINNNYNEIYSFERLICKFIKLLKSNNYTIYSFNNFINKCFIKKEKLYLCIDLNIYLIYEN